MDPDGAAEFIGPYRLLAKIGEGGMGVVYRVEDPQTGQHFALKTVRKVSEHDIGRMRYEIHALTRTHHPGVVRFVAEGMHDGHPWYAMELLEGLTLQDIKRDIFGITPATRTDTTIQGTLDGASGGSVPDDSGFDTNPSRPVQSTRRATPATASGGQLERVLEIMHRLCAPLAFIHGNGIVHRDLKPSNVLIRADGTPVLADFGLVSQFRDAGGRDVVSVTGSAIGTPAYMAPEQISGEVVDARTDLYALGCMLYELVTGDVPFAGDSYFELIGNHLLVAPTAPSAMVQGVPPGLDALILGLLAKQPRDRVGHAEDVAIALEKLGAPATPANSATQARAYLYRPALAGRDEHLGDFERRVVDACDGRGGFVLMGGESGVGKSCLATAVASAAARHDMRVIAGECVPVGTVGTSASEARAAPLHPFRRMLEAIADCCRVGGSEITGRVLGSRGMVLKQYEPALASLPEIAAMPDPAELPADAARERLFAMLAATITAFAAEQPLLLIFDDLQWADELTLAFLSSLTREVTHEHPLLILGTFRSEEKLDGLRGILNTPWIDRIQLGRLDDATVGAIVGDMLALPEPPPEFVAFMSRHSEGNPFFVAEYLRVAVAEGVLDRENGQWRLARRDFFKPASYAALPLPRSLREIVGRRLAGLTPSARKLAETASVLGREVDDLILAGVASMADADALEALKDLVARQVLEEARDGGLRFAHDKLREITYEGIDAGRRRDLHARAGAAIEARYAGRLDFELRFSELAHHWKQAGENSKSLEYVIGAGEQALRTGGYADAVRLFTEALTLDPDTSSPAARFRHARWERQIGEAYVGLALPADARPHLNRAVELLGWPMPASDIAIGAGLVAEMASQVPHRLWPSRFVDAAHDDPARHAEAIRAYDLLQEANRFTGKAPLILYTAFRALNLAERAAPSPALATAYALAQAIVATIPMPPLAETYGRLARQTLERAGDPSAQTYVLKMASVCALGQACWDVSLGDAQQAANIARDIGFVRRWEEVMIVVGWTHVYTGRFQMARDSFEALYQSSLRGDTQHQLWSLAGLATLAMTRGDLTEAAEFVRKAEAICETRREPLDQVWGHALVAAVRMREGDWAATREAADACNALMASMPPVFIESVRAALMLAEVYVTMWQSGGRGRGDIAGIESAAKRCCKALHAQKKAFPVVTPGAWLWQGEYEWLSGQRSRALESFAASLAWSRRLGMPHDEARAHQALAQRVSEPFARRQHTEHARQILARLDLGPSRVAPVVTSTPAREAV